MVHGDSDPRSRPDAAGRFSATRHSSVQIDPDECVPGALYVAILWDLAGRPEADAIKTAVGNGAVAVFTNLSRLPFALPVPVIHAGPTNRVLAALALAARAEYTGRVVAVTGSVGKTTTRELIHHVLSRSGLSYRTPRNRNGFGGICQTIINRPLGSRFTVMELATSRPGNLRHARFVRPHVGVVTNVGVSHLENYGSPGAILREKVSLFDHLEGERVGIVHRSVLDADDAGERLIRSKQLSRLLTVGADSDNDIHLSDVAFDGTGTRGTMSIRGRAYRFSLSLPGRHFVDNAMCAMAVACALGLDIGVSVEALATATPADRRFQRYKIAVDGGAIELIDDAFNAAPASVAALLATLAERRAKRVVLVFGDMLELGADSARRHRDIAPLIENAGVDFLVTVGAFARLANPGSIETVHFVHADAAAAAIPALLRPQDLIAVKASSAIGLVKVVSAIRRMGDSVLASAWRIEDEGPA